METWKDFAWFCFWMLAYTAVFGLASFGLLVLIDPASQVAAGFIGIGGECIAIVLANVTAWWQRDRQFRRDLDAYAVRAMRKYDTYPGSYAELRERLRNA